MKQIPLTQGQFALVDDTDYDWLNQWKWCVTGIEEAFYAIRNSPKIEGKSHQIFMHRVILGLEYKDGQQGDHTNHNTLDNRRANLRICTQQQNQMNQKLQKNKTSRFKGVCWDKQHKKWKAGIKVKKELKNLGRFNTEEDAATAYNKAAKKYFGEFAFLNNIP